MNKEKIKLGLLIHNPSGYPMGMEAYIPINNVVTTSLTEEEEFNLGNNLLLAFCEQNDKEFAKQYMVERAVSRHELKDGRIYFLFTVKPKK